MVDASPGESATVSVLLDVPGDWLINCLREDDYPAVIFQVFDEASDSSPHSGLRSSTHRRRVPECRLNNRVAPDGVSLPRS
jgi:hypothetical protein